MEIKLKLKDYKSIDYQVHGNYYKEEGYAYDDNKKQYKITIFIIKEDRYKYLKGCLYIQIFKIEKYTEDDKGYLYPNGCMLIDNDIATFSEEEEKIKISTVGGDNIELVYREDYGEGL